MAKRIPLTGTREIVVLDSHETIANQCARDDVAVRAEGDGFAVYWVGTDGEVSFWEGSFDSEGEAVSAIKDFADNN